jgi:hypothetical protein
MNRYNNSKNRYNVSLEHIDLSENSQRVANVLQDVQRFDESYNDSRYRNNDSLECIDLSENGQSVVNVLQSVPRFKESYNDSRIVITIQESL